MTARDADSVEPARATRLASDRYAIWIVAACLDSDEVPLRPKTLAVLRDQLLESHAVVGIIIVIVEGGTCEALRLCAGPKSTSGPHLPC